MEKLKEIYAYERKRLHVHHTSVERRTTMFEKFGNFNTYEEINATAQGLKNEGDTENLYTLAAENGIDKETAQMYAEGKIPCLCDIQSAAMGKLDIEAAELKTEEIMADWVEYIKGSIAKDDKLAAAVRNSSKNLKACIAELLKWSFKNAKPMDKDILKAAGVNQHCTLGIPGMGKAKKIIREYYSGRQEPCRKKK